jgi:leucine dehydrogenase
MGGAVNDRSLHNLKCKILAGSANNQLENPEKHGEELFHKDILYAPDYILNAGGVINIYVHDILKKMDSMPWIKKIEGHLTKIFKLSKKKNIPPLQIANNLTEKILSEKIKAS